MAIYTRFGTEVKAASRYRGGYLEIEYSNGSRREVHANDLKATGGLLEIIEACNEVERQRNALLRSLKLAAWNLVDEYGRETDARAEAAELDSGFGWRVYPDPVDPTPYRDRFLALLARYGVEYNEFYNFLLGHIIEAEKHGQRPDTNEADGLLYYLMIHLDLEVA